MKRALPLILISSLIIPIQSPANAAIKAGGKCSVLGTSIVELGNLDVNYCSTSTTGGTSKSKILDTVDNYRFKSICEKDPFVPTEWKEYESFFIKARYF